MASRATVASAGLVHLDDSAAASRGARPGERPIVKVLNDSTPSLRIAMMGPALSVMGGISSVERIILDSIPAQINARHIATMEEGGKVRKTLRYGYALLQARSMFRSRPDLVHIHFASRASSIRKMFLADLAIRRGVPVLMHAHGGYYQDYWREMNRSERARAQHVFNNMHGLIVLGSVWRDFFVSIGVAPTKICVLPNPVVLPAVVPAREGSSRVRAVYLGLMSDAKGTFDLIEAVSRAGASVKARLRLVLAGNGETQRARGCVAKKGLSDIIEVRDWVDVTQRDQLLAASELFFLPSYREGLPMSMLEAMAWGVAPICSPVGSVGEVIAPEQNGMLVPPGDIDALTQALSELVLNDRKRASMGMTARKSVEPLSDSRYIERLVEVYAAAARGQSISDLSLQCKL